LKSGFVTVIDPLYAFVPVEVAVQLTSVPNAERPKLRPRRPNPVN